MRRRNVILGIVALMVIGALAVMLWPEKPEPVYKGRKLSEWIMEPHKQGGGRGDHWSAEVTQGISWIGTNGIPFYLEWIGYEPGPFARAKLQIASKLTYWFNSRWQP